MRALELPKNWPGVEFFKLIKSSIWENQISTVVT